jgi:hypothetical protein
MCCDGEPPGTVLNSNSGHSGFAGMNGLRSFVDQRDMASPTIVQAMAATTRFTANITGRNRAHSNEFSIRSSLSLKPAPGSGAFIFGHLRLFDFRDEATQFPNLDAVTIRQAARLGDCLFVVVAGYHGRTADHMPVQSHLVEAIIRHGQYPYRQRVDVNVAYMRPSVRCLTQPRINVVT